ncbi:thioredoxin domain-containing protein-like [Clavelina lepadiformis]|uniref:thioredoxin domain-containing protein-like n=1 Tax=Clavelina lepadiformis TaxID=159417 RepID=UPI004041AD2E
MKFIICFIVTFLSVFNGGTSEFDPNAVSHTTKAELLSMIEEEKEVLVYFYTNFEDCLQCKEKMPQFHETAVYLEKLEEGKVKSYKLAIKFPEYGVNSFPQLIFFHGKIPFRYDKPDEFTPDNILDWVEEAKQTPLPELSDETFEHLTQASTGATTGDWLIMFANGQRPECMKPNLPDLATTAARLRRRKNVAIVNTSVCPVIGKRFEIHPQNHCVKLLFFHRTEMYHYDKTDRSSAALLKYVLQDYSKDEVLKIPPPLDHKNAELESMIAALKAHFLEHANISQLTFFSGVGFGLLGVFAALLFILRRYRKKKLL